MSTEECLSMTRLLYNAGVQKQLFQGKLQLLCTVFAPLQYIYYVDLVSDLINKWRNGLFIHVLVD